MYVFLPEALRAGEALEFHPVIYDQLIDGSLHLYG